MYNVLEAVRRGEPLTARDKAVHEQGLVGVLLSLHDELDAAVLAAYGWADLTLPADTDTLLERLVALNARRAAEEAAGTVRWLRPEFQCSGAATQAARDTDSAEPDDALPAATDAAPADACLPGPAAPPARPWPTGLPEQIKAVAEVMAASPAALTLDDLATRFTGRGRWRDRLPTLVETLVALGRLRPVGAARWSAVPY